MANINDCNKEALLQEYLEWCHSKDSHIARVTVNYACLYLFDKCISVSVQWDGSRWNEVRRRALR
jgi:hypothetical protein